jgi:hypothetical protein
MATAWVYVINNGSGTPNVVRRSHSATTVVPQQPGVYRVTFPPAVQWLACVATLNNSVGTITAVPGDNAGLPANQVTVSTLTLQNQFLGSLDFSLAVFYNPRRPDVIDTGGLLISRAATRSRRRTRPRR